MLTLTLLGITALQGFDMRMLRVLSILAHTNNWDQFSGYTVCRQ